MSPRLPRGLPPLLRAPVDCGPAEAASDPASDLRFAPDAALGTPSRLLRPPSRPVTPWPGAPEPDER